MGPVGSEVAVDAVAATVVAYSDCMNRVEMTDAGTGWNAVVGAGAIPIHSKLNAPGR